jgi:hypothetical protein
MARRQVVPNPVFALDLIENQLKSETQGLTKIVNERVREADDLALIDASVLYVLKALEQRVRKFANIQFFSENTWRAIIGFSQQVSFITPELNAEWLRSDIDEFLSDVVSPWLGASNQELVLPEDSRERYTPNDEYLIHAMAVVNVGLGFVRGVSATIPNYGDVTAIMGRLREYFSLMEARGTDYEPFSWDDGS